MGNNALLVLVMVLIFIVVLLLLIGLFNYFLGRRVVPNRYEWLKVLNRTDWKSTLQLREDMETLKETSRGWFLVYEDIGNLVDEKLVEERVSIKETEEGSSGISEYRLTSSGSRKKLETGMQEKEKNDRFLQPA